MKCRCVHFVRPVLFLLRAYDQEKKGQSPLDLPSVLELNMQGFLELLEFKLEAFDLLGYVQTLSNVIEAIAYHAGELFDSISHVLLGGKWSELFGEYFFEPLFGELGHRDGVNGE